MKIRNVGKDNPYAIVRGWVGPSAAAPDFTPFPWKEPVRVATTTSGTLASSFENGDTIDGIVLATDDRILIKDQAAPAQNGIYIVNASGAPSRADDMDTSDEFPGAIVYITSGTVNAATSWVCTNTTEPVVDTDSVTFALIGGSSASLTIKDEGTPLATAASSLDFVGAGVTATGSGAAKTITIPGKGTPATSYGTPAAGSPTTYIGTGATITPPTEAEVTFTDITTNNVSTSKHGYTPKLPNDATKYLDGSGAYSVPAGSGSGTTDHEHVNNIQYNGDGVTTAFELPAAPFDEQSVVASIAGVIQDVTLSGAILTTMTFLSAPASGTKNVRVDIVAAVG